MEVFFMKLHINTIMTLCYIIDSYEEFNNNLLKIFPGRDNFNNILNISKLAYRENVFGAKKVKNFYKENKEVIDTINNTSGIFSFLCDITDNNGNIKNIDSLYNYLKEHKEEIDKILLVLKKIRKLDISYIYFDENLDFTNTIYKIKTNYDNNDNIFYLDNMEVIPNYPGDTIYYKTYESNYRLVLKGGTYMNYCSKEIELNSLLFDPDKLPKEISKEYIFDKIINSKENVIDKCSSIYDSVNLSISIKALQKEFNKTRKVIEGLNNVRDKEELIDRLLLIKNSLEELQIMSKELDEKITKEYPIITEEQLNLEKKKILERKIISDSN